MPNAARCSDWRLYVILDRTAAGSQDLAELAERAIQGGADVLQLRDKHGLTRDLLADGERVLARARRAGVPLIINDRVDVAIALGADGAHLGQDDLPLPAARKLLGPGRLLGRSTHSLAQARAAAAEGADYIGVGPVFATPTKPDYGSVGLELVRQVAAEISVPFVCIGGLDAGHASQVLEAGARCLAVVRAVCAAPDPREAAKELKQLISDFHRAPRTSPI